MVNKMMLQLFRASAIISLFASCGLATAIDVRNSRICEAARYQNKPRVFVATDIGNEPDDQMSLVRFLTYANEFDIKGIVASTSTHKRTSVDEHTIREVVSAYGNVTANLNAHVPSYAPYPSAEELLAKVTSGYPIYGLAALELEPSNASLALVEAVDNTADDESLWALMWGGAVVLAEALNHVSKTRDSTAITAFVSKLRVYTISDQDDTGAWIRATYPSLFYIASLHAFTEYALSTWSGISGEAFYYFDTGRPDTSLVTNEWLEQHIRIGELGSHYPHFEYIMEGDTPSFLHLIRNGLGDPEHPEYGGWGGRYKLLDNSGNTNTYTDAADLFRGSDGHKYMSQQGTIWRWRKDYQWDFANRMQWSTTQNYSQANHAPVVSVNSSCGSDVWTIPYEFTNTTTSFVLDASASWDPDNDELEFNWLWYLDVTSGTAGSGGDIQFVGIEDLNPLGSTVNVTLSPRPSRFANTTFHVVLSVTDPGNATTYQRIIFDPTSN